MLTGELGGSLAAVGVLTQQFGDLPVEPGLLHLGERLVEHVVVLLGQQVGQRVGDA